MKVYDLTSYNNDILSFEFSFCLLKSRCLHHLCLSFHGRFPDMVSEFR